MTIRLLDANKFVLGTIERVIDPDGHLSEILGPLFGNIEVASELFGRVEVESDVPVSGMTLMLDGTRLTFFPIFPIEPDTEIILLELLSPLPGG